MGISEREYAKLLENSKIQQRHSAVRHDKAVVSPVQRDRGMNKTEAAYARHLDSMGAVWKYESVKLRLADNTFFTPDFMVIDGGVRMVDTKAYWKSKGSFHAEDDAMVKIKVAAEQYPWFSFEIAWFDPSVNAWQHKAI